MSALTPEQEQRAEAVTLAARLMRSSGMTTGHPGHVDDILDVAEWVVTGPGDDVAEADSDGGLPWAIVDELGSSEHLHAAAPQRDTYTCRGCGGQHDLTELAESLVDMDVHRAREASSAAGAGPAVLTTISEVLTGPRYRAAALERARTLMEAVPSIDEAVQALAEALATKAL